MGNDCQGLHEVPEKRSFDLCNISYRNDVSAAFRASVDYDSSTTYAENQSRKNVTDHRTVISGSVFQVLRVP